MELLFWRKHAGRPQCFFLLTTACRYFSDKSHYEFGKMFVTRITLSHAFTFFFLNEQMSNIVSAQNFLALWNLNPGATSSCSAVWITCMQFVRVLENITFCSLFIVWGHFAISIITVTSNNHPFLFSSETWDAALNSLWLSVFCACNDFCISLTVLNASTLQTCLLH